MEKGEFERLLKTARIELDEEEYSSIEKDINEILRFFDKLENVSLENEELAFHPVEIPEKLRDDSTENKNEIENIFYNGENYRFYFLGPKI
ncbi:MAG: Asp-tRNA(Asn)/Glu-tRNA(Gln) amidotransferase subunit GatC [Candidatus Parvarchaeum sp.]|nr:Asp-tRNA(Asn)/Glu-tRNA(Gln) amidotransferase subunit GatC [Candidatus Parvarchaeota archaeon]MCW1294764.1 Asp-tRNA(Asn)/Glu-tRNA(Gln) amidotransferase subunit GatC [Candidatus Parvarchaeum tengchongense]MCW1295777.1 Asp-tRNA(Asn)/Glu-tRNA(Gln) amidotransferase subunit GatC [Candidatus Parvarchaeum tengchongense]MCW1298859.1 Asp-tRNA(Asn)/Glu-tRNA(Gln) amidotransferase subunit GatC [Candidatus Parvarchaeum tengchongense]